MDSAALQEQLRQRAFLHNDPDAYLAGVRDALQLLADDLVVDEADVEHARGA